MTKLNLDTTVGAIACELPGAAELFRQHGIGFCCDGDVSLADAAVEVGIVARDLLERLQALEQAARRDAPDGTNELIAHILERYHQTHRNDLEWLIPLAQKVEHVHAAHPDAPLGLAKALVDLQDQLVPHMAREELALFPMMRNEPDPDIEHLIGRMRDDHVCEGESLATIEHLTHGFTLPGDACRSWTALYVGLRKFSDDLVTHMHLENKVLFPRFSYLGEDEGAAPPS
ncbi:regulator of cell morphogenesis and NO signaling [Ensifer adhaerens]|uniref:Regulator of cell morphogenesis and NO signaling n=1 Tax=Ensifer adhaerens TaxID=106592 RepID=A0A0L8BHJ3_ENSAD|nr:iron-sulfur cluster repair di-iron protein [Ensifer adhaerens]KOF14035.1 regulator of cell morphogenesis and NO signaling [Ensifer adhaerens]